MDSSLFDSLTPTRTRLHTTRHHVALDDAFAALSDAWSRGVPLRVEEILHGMPPVGRSARLELIYHEYCLADALGVRPSADEYYARFPDLRADLHRMIGLHDVLDGSPSLNIPAEEFPESGDEVGPYRLVRELGKGGMARVYLAEQTDLDDRLVVVKLAMRPSLEANLLARAQHPYIVPIIRQAHAEGGGLNLIAMPFLGGQALSGVLAEMRREGHARSGADLLAALDRVAAPEFSATKAQSAIRQRLAGLSWPQAVAWMVARMAEALDHAGRLGVTHGDLKPANILIAADGRPMLLDFNLAVDWRSPDAELSSVAGGTLAYMAPERLRAVADPKSASPTRPAERQKADLYALGLVLREAISGQVPELPRDCPRFREAASLLAQTREHASPRAWCAVPGLPASLKPVLARLLTPEPIDRYASMAHLAEDLDRWVANRPLKHARERPRSGVRTLQWIRRKRLPLAVAASVVMAAALVATLANARMNQRLRQQAEAKLAALWDSGDPAIFRVRRFGQWRRDEDDDADLARRNLNQYGVLGPGNWRDRDDVRALGDRDRADLEMWLMEQTWRLASALAERVDATDDWDRALALLEQSPEWVTLPAFASLRNRLYLRLGRTEPPLAHQASPEWLEAYAAGLEAESRSSAEAAQSYTQVLDIQPDAFWAIYRGSVVASRMSRHAEASRLLARCVERRPRNPAIWTLRAGCLLGASPTGSIPVFEESLRYCDRALAIDPDFRDAYLVRCVARSRLNLVEGQVADITRYGQLSRVQGQAMPLGLALMLNGLSGSVVAPGEGSENTTIQELIAEQLHRAGKVDEAIAVYDEVLTSQPDHLGARFGRACLLFNQRRNEGFYELVELFGDPRFERLVQADKRAIVAISHVVSTYLLRKDLDEARRLAEFSLSLSQRFSPDEPNAVAMLAESYYSLARVLAHDATSNPEAATRAAELLDRAGRIDARILEERFKNDRFFDPARQAIQKASCELRCFSPVSSSKTVLGPAIASP